MLMSGNTQTVFANIINEWKCANIK